jgi:hypothetical protein
MMLEAEDEPLFAERAAGIDIAKAGIEVAVSRLEPLRVRDKFGAGPAGPGIVATSTNPSFG